MASVSNISTTLLAKEGTYTMVQKMQNSNCVRILDRGQRQVLTPMKMTPSDIGIFSSTQSCVKFVAIKQKLYLFKSSILVKQSNSA